MESAVYVGAMIYFVPYNLVLTTSHVLNTKLWPEKSADFKY
jgi:hypothetical protein